MMFLTYWKVNESFPNERTIELAQTLEEQGLFPAEGTEIIRWVGTPDLWGIVLWEAEDFSALFRGLSAWRVAAGEEAFFEKTKTAPAADVEDTIQEQAEFLAQID